MIGVAFEGIHNSVFHGGVLNFKVAIKLSPHRFHSLREHPAIYRDILAIWDES